MSNWQMSYTNKGRKNDANMPEERPDIRVDGWTWTGRTGSDCNLRPSRGRRMVTNMIIKGAGV